MKSANQPISMLLDRAEAPADQISPWCVSKFKRTFDFMAGSSLLVLASPAMLVIALLVRVSSTGPILFRQLRVGQGGRGFFLLKFRTMTDRRQEPGPALTQRGDPRVTSIGRFLRKFKLDELPQLINIVCGDMSLVGPRPDVPEYYQALDSVQRKVLYLRPGATGAATLQFRNEEVLLAQVPQTELVSFYTDTLLPKKIAIDLEYARQATFFSDLSLLSRTITSVLVAHTPGGEQ
jgi:lipopolysaccharide/colanic/teichoic acid biosynthesis glycosyltransferase